MSGSKIAKGLRREAELHKEQQAALEKVGDYSEANDHKYMSRLMLQAANRLEELEAMESKLPKTADGVPIQVGDEVWLAGFGKYPGYVAYIMDDMVAINDMADWPASDCDSIHEYTVRHPASLYSTREAALAAKETHNA